MQAASQSVSQSVSQIDLVIFQIVTDIRVVEGNVAAARSTYEYYGTTTREVGLFLQNCQIINV